MPVHYEIETDTLYLRGLEKGIKEGRQKSVLSLWRNGIEPPIIANLLNLPIEEIEQIIAQYQNENVDKSTKK